MSKKHVLGIRQPEQTKPQLDPTPEELRRVMSALGRKGGKKGGIARAAKLTGKRRSEIAKQAASARWTTKR